jgi:hypothetical protein
MAGFNHRYKKPMDETFEWFHRIMQSNGRGDTADENFAGRCAAVRSKLIFDLNDHSLGPES